MTRDLPAFTPLRAWAAAIAATAVLGVPLTALPILDGLLFINSGVLVARDLAMLLALGILACAGWVALSSLVGFGLNRWLGSARGSLWAWTIVLLPLALLVLRQTGRVGLEWLRSVSPWVLTLSPLQKLALLAVFGGLGLVWMLRTGWQRSLGHLLAGFEALRPLAWGLCIGALALIAWRPPVWMPAGAKAPSTVQVTAPAKPHILVLAIDTVAAQDAAACRSDSATMPNLARFASAATCFTRFQAASNFTTASVSSIESGLLPWHHHANQPDATIVPPLRNHTVAQALRDQGWRTHFITDNLLGSPRHRGSFEGYDSAPLAPTTLWVNAVRFAATRWPDTALPRLVSASLAFLAPLDERRHQHQSPYRSEAVYDALHAALDAERAHGAPQFVFTLSLPPHAPYLPPPSTRYKLLPPGVLDRLSDLMPDNMAYPSAQQPVVDQHRLRYRESLMAADAALGRTLDRLEREGWLKNAIVIVTSDHGESFEKGYLGHAGVPVHQALANVPFVVKLPGQTEGRVVHQAASQVDIAPTLLDLTGIAPLPRAEGRSLRPVLEGRELPDAPVFTMALERQRRDTPIQSGRVAVVDGPWKLILHLDDGHHQLFHLDRDPLETQDLSAQHPAEVQRLQATIRQRIARVDVERGLARP